MLQQQGSTYFLKVLRDAALPRIRFHDLRHLYASALTEQGESITCIQRQLGHSSPTVTLKACSHLFNEANPDAVSRLEKTFLKRLVKIGSQTKKRVTAFAVTR